MSSGNVPTFYAVSSLDEGIIGKSDLNTSLISVVNDELNRIGGEMGISAYDRQTNQDEEKVANTIEIYKKKLGNYEFKSLFLNNFDKNLYDTLIGTVNKLTSIRSLVSDWDDGTSISYYNNSIVNIPVITEGFTYTDEELFKLQSVATALGVVTHEIDMEDIIYPENDEDDWSKAFSDFTSAVDTYWVKYKCLDALNITGVNSRISNFLAMTPNIIIDNNSIKISIDGFDTEAYFMLRTEKEIATINNGSFTKVEDGAYLIYANDANVEITLK